MQYRIRSWPIRALLSDRDGRPKGQRSRLRVLCSRQTGAGAFAPGRPQRLGQTCDGSEGQAHWHRHRARTRIPKMRTHAAAIAILLLSTPALGADTLEPAGPSAESRERHLTGAFKDLFESDVQARVIVERAATPQFAAGIDHQGDEYRIFAIDAAGPQWTAIEDRKPAAARCELAITLETAHAVLGVWKAMLLGMRTQLDTADIEGAVYYFSMDVDGALRIGQTTEQLPSSRSGQMISLASAMRDACRTKGTSDLRRIPALAAALQGDLNAPR